VGTTGPDAAVARARALSGLSRYDEAHGALQPYLAVPQPPLRVLLEAARVAFAAGRPADSLAAVQQGLRVAGDDERSRADLLLELLRNETDTGRPELAVEHGAQAAALYERLGVEHRLSVVLRVVGDAHRKLGQWDEAAAALARAGELAGRTGAVEEQAATLLNLAIVHKHQGDLDAAVHASSQCTADRGAAGAPVRADGLPGQPGDFHLEQGALAAAAERCEQALALTTRTGNARQRAMVLTTQAQIRLATGDLAGARRAAEEGRALAEEVGLVEAVALADEVLARATA
jgi:tetratricopeptide (TPR) repeat protein